MARHPHSGLVPAAGGGVRNPEQAREPARSCAFRSQALRRADRYARPGAQRPAVGFSPSLLLPPGGCCLDLRRYSRLDTGPDPGGVTELDQLVCDGNLLYGSIVATAGVGQPSLPW